MISNDDILKWINSMPLWFKKATVLFYQNNEISDKDITMLADCCFNDENYKVEGINLIYHGKRNNFSLKCISDVKGVNAICSDKPLAFNPKGITVIYGLNGSGKSGYIRILKMVSGAKYRENIKNNIYSDTEINPRASITITNSESKDSRYECDLRKPAEYNELTCIDIFDTKIADAYMKESKEASFEPWVFGYLVYMAEVAGRIKNELESRKNKYIESPYSFPDTLKDTAAYKELKSITYKSKLNDFPSVWNEEDETKLAELKENNQASVLKSKLVMNEDKIKNIGILKAYFTPFINFFYGDNWEEIQKTQNELHRAKEFRIDAENLFKDNASELDADSVRNESWRALWKYSKQYYDEMIFPKNRIQFAEDGSFCPLCGQKISDHDCANRMKSINIYINGKATEEEENLYKKYNSLLKKYPSVKQKDELETIIELAGITDKKSELLKHNDFFKSYSLLINDDKVTDEIKQYDTSLLKGVIEDHSLSLEQENSTIRELMSSEKQKQLEKKIHELEAIKCLTAQFEIIKNNIIIKNKINEIEKAEKLLSTNKITTKSRELAADLLTAEYIERFQNEVQFLTKNNLAVEIVQQRAGKGRIPFKVVLVDSKGNNISPQDILSEGENRVTSLAAFFAESSGRQENVPLIFDDPISSLDYNYEGLVIERLIQAATQRQVIVFTHRISMVVGLSEAADKRGVDYHEVSLRSNRSKKGVPNDNSDIGGKAKSKLNVLIDKDLPQLKRIEELSDEFDNAYRNICSEFRNIVEKSIEEVLLGGVVQRFRRDIQTKNRLNKLSEITKEDCEMFDQLMSKYSFYDHPAPDEAPLIGFDIGELEHDLKMLRGWIKEHS